MTPELRAEYRSYAWNYFALHAAQRLQAFNFFVAFSTVLIGAFVAIIANKGIARYYALLPLALLFVSFVFWKLEERTRMLVKHGENALKVLDQEALKDEQNGFAALALFSIDDMATSRLKKYPIWQGYYSYSRCFRWIYVAAGALGFLGVIFCLVKA